MLGFCFSRKHIMYRKQLILNLNNFQMENGCVEFLINPQELYLSSRLSTNTDSRMYLYITSTITEAGTNKIDITYGKVYIYFKPYSFKFVSNAIFQPGLPYKGKLKFFNVKTNVTNELIEICYNLALKRSWNYLNMEHCSNFSVGNDNVIDFSILPLKSSIIHIILKVSECFIYLIQYIYLLKGIYELHKSGNLIIKKIIL